MTASVDDSPPLEEKASGNDPVMNVLASLSSCSVGPSSAISRHSRWMILIASASLALSDPTDPVIIGAIRRGFKEVSML